MLSSHDFPSPSLHFGCWCAESENRVQNVFLFRQMNVALGSETRRPRRTEKDRDIPMRHIIIFDPEIDVLFKLSVVVGISVTRLFVSHLCSSSRAIKMHNVNAQAYFVCLLRIERCSEPNVRAMHAQLFGFRCQKSALGPTLEMRASRNEVKNH